MFNTYNAKIGTKFVWVEVDSLYSIIRFFHATKTKGGAQIEDVPHRVIQCESLMQMEELATALARDAQNVVHSKEWD